MEQKNEQLRNIQTGQYNQQFIDKLSDKNRSPYPNHDPVR